MDNQISSPQQPLAAGIEQPLYVPIKRRSFFMYAGATAGATALLLAGCKDDSTDPGMVDVGSGDTGVLNYAYALEQLESAFYSQVIASQLFSGTTFSTSEKQVLTDLALHEKIHVDFFRTALGTSAIKALTPDFSAIDFNSRTSILNTAQAFEDLGVQAYNGAGRYITNVDYLTLAGKIVSVEARHAALIRDIIAYNSFVGTVSNTTVSAGVIDPTIGPAVTSPNLTTTSAATYRSEQSKDPATVLMTANNYLASGSKLSANSLK